MFMFTFFVLFYSEYLISTCLKIYIHTENKSYRITFFNCSKLVYISRINEIAGCYFMLKGFNVLKSMHHNNFWFSFNESFHLKLSDMYKYLLNLCTVSTSFSAIATDNFEHCIL